MEASGSKASIKATVIPEIWPKAWFCQSVGMIVPITMTTDRLR